MNSAGKNTARSNLLTVLRAPSLVAPVVYLRERLARSVLTLSYSASLGNSYHDYDLEPGPFRVDLLLFFPRTDYSLPDHSTKIGIQNP